MDRSEAKASRTHNSTSPKISKTEGDSEALYSSTVSKRVSVGQCSRESIGKSRRAYKRWTFATSLRAWAYSKVLGRDAAKILSATAFAIMARDVTFNLFVIE